MATILEQNTVQCYFLREKEQKELHNKHGTLKIKKDRSGHFFKV